jgi:hypothetical protein
MAEGFVVGGLYTREQIADRIALPPGRRGGSWSTGYDEWDGAFFVFANIGNPGRTGHDYPNRWNGKELIWYGKSRTRLGQRQIDRLVSNTVPVHFFWRTKDRAPFTYAGIGTALTASEGTPVEVVWTFGDQAAKISSVPEKSAPRWRHGPPPVKGSASVTRVDGPTDVYLLRLEGSVGALIEMPPDCVCIKVGMTNDVTRRLVELNAGFPPGSSVHWRLEKSSRAEDARSAYQLEGSILEQLRIAKRWIGGEFAIVPEKSLLTIIP